MTKNTRKTTKLLGHKKNTEKKLKTVNHKKKTKTKTPDDGKWKNKNFNKTTGNF